MGGVAALRRLSSFSDDKKSRELASSSQLRWTDSFPPAHGQGRGRRFFTDDHRWPSYQIFAHWKKNTAQFCYSLGSGPGRDVGPRDPGSEHRARVRVGQSLTPQCQGPRHGGIRRGYRLPFCLPWSPPAAWAPLSHQTLGLLPLFSGPLLLTIIYTGHLSRNLNGGFAVGENGGGGECVKYCEKGNYWFLIRH